MSTGNKETPVTEALSLLHKATGLLEAQQAVEAEQAHTQAAAEEDDDGFVFTSTAPMEGRCDICARGPLPWVQNLRALEVTQAQRTEEWFEARKQCVTASELASVLGENPYCSRIQTLRRKLGLVENSFTSFACQHGNDNEDRAIAMYEKKTGHTVMSFGLLRSQVEGQCHLAGSPDGITHCGRLVEVKCPVTRQIIPGVVPKHYRSQIELLMHVTGIRVADFIQMGTAQLVFDITACPPTPNYYRLIRAKVDKFVELLKEAREDDQALAKYQRKRATKPKTEDPDKTFAAGFIL
tara:strand:- start:691 stop:1575 length:885 start_codon:yes stop_codon:yes gene_type:complete